MGTHLYNYLGLKEEVKRIPFEDAFFSDENILKDFVKQCDVIIHLAAMNRHGDPQVIYDTNIMLVNKLLAACEVEKVTPHILFSSSSQEERDNLYGKSKKEGRELFENWAKENNARFTGMVIPNVFGPFGLPYYNSVVATFCHQLAHNETPQIDIDGDLKLIYINELVEEIFKKIVETRKDNIIRYDVPHTSESKVSEILSILKSYKDLYFDKGIIPFFKNKFELNLFNTFRCYMPDEKFPFKYVKHTDNRGAFVELIRANTSGQSSYSTTVPGITRGNHFHTRKIERFAVIKGKARIEIRRIGTGKIVSYDLNGDEPAFVDMPIWSTHNITNIGDEELLTMFWINEPYDPNDPDTYFKEV